MKNLAIKTLFLFCIASMFVACKKDDAKPKKNFDIYVDYWNPTGSDPMVKFNATKTSDEVKIDFDKPFVGVPINQVEAAVLIDNFRIIDNNFKNYTVKEILPYEKNDLGEWILQTEATLDVVKTEEGLSTVLVIDRSTSLGDDFGNVKQNAIDFVNKLFEETNNKARIGVVDFALNVNSLAITNNKTAIIDYINALEMEAYTSLYEAVDEAIDMLLLETTAESKAILGFTDGADDSQSATITSSYLHEKLVNDDSKRKISSFMIGYGTAVSTNVLQNLCTNGGMYQFPKTASELETVFDNFSKAIANVYNLTYTRRQGVISESSPAELKFAIETE